MTFSKLCYNLLQHKEFLWLQCNSLLTHYLFFFSSFIIFKCSCFWNFRLLETRRKRKTNTLPIYQRRIEIFIGEYTRLWQPICWCYLWKFIWTGESGWIFGVVSCIFYWRICVPTHSTGIYMKNCDSFFTLAIIDNIIIVVFTYILLNFMDL